MEERFDQFEGDLNLDKLVDHADTFSEPSLKDPLGERFDLIWCNLDLDKFLKQAVMYRETSLEDPLEERFAQFEFDLDLDMTHEQAKALLDPTPKMRTENGEEEKEEQVEPPPIFPMTKKWVLKLTSSSQSLSRHIMNQKFHLLNVSKNRFM